MPKTQEMRVQLSNRVTTFFLDDSSAEDDFEEANELPPGGVTEPYEVSELGKFVCIDENKNSLLKTPDGLEAFFSELRLGSVWSNKVGTKNSRSLG